MRRVRNTLPLPVVVLTYAYRVSQSAAFVVPNPKPRTVALHPPILQVSQLESVSQPNVDDEEEDDQEEEDRRVVGNYLDRLGPATPHSLDSITQWSSSSRNFEQYLDSLTEPEDDSDQNTLDNEQLPKPIRPLMDPSTSSYQPPEPRRDLRPTTKSEPLRSINLLLREMDDSTLIGQDGEKKDSIPLETPIKSQEVDRQFSSHSTKQPDPSDNSLGTVFIANVPLNKAPLTVQSQPSVNPSNVTNSSMTKALRLLSNPNIGINTTAKASRAKEQLQVLSNETQCSNLTIFPPTSVVSPPYAFSSSDDKVDNPGNEKSRPLISNSSCNTQLMDTTNSDAVLSAETLKEEEVRAATMKGDIKKMNDTAVAFAHRVEPIPVPGELFFIRQDNTSSGLSNESPCSVWNETNATLKTKSTTIRPTRDRPFSVQAQDVDKTTAQETIPKELLEFEEILKGTVSTDAQNVTSSSPSSNNANADPNRMKVDASANESMIQFKDVEVQVNLDAISENTTNVATGAIVDNVGSSTPKYLTRSSVERPIPEKQGRRMDNGESQIEKFGTSFTSIRIGRTRPLTTVLALSEETSHEEKKEGTWVSIAAFLSELEYDESYNVGFDDSSLVDIISRTPKPPAPESLPESKIVVEGLASETWKKSVKDRLSIVCTMFRALSKRFVGFFGKRQMETSRTMSREELTLLLQRDQANERGQITTETTADKDAQQFEEAYMQLAVAMAFASVDLNATSVPPFPVGAVIIGKDGSIIGEGVSSDNETAIEAALSQAGLDTHHNGDQWTVRGKRKVRDVISASSLYVTFEPSSLRSGNKPPLTELISVAGLSSVVIGIPDTSKPTLGTKALNEAGIDVSLGIVATEDCQSLLDAYVELAGSEGNGIPPSLKRLFLTLTKSTISVLSTIKNKAISRENIRGIQRALSKGIQTFKKSESEN